MTNSTPAAAPGFGAEAPVPSIQPGGGRCMRMELAWGRLRRRFLRRYFPDYVARMTAKRQGQCDRCRAGHGCAGDVIDPRDLKYFRNVCGYSFKPEDDAFRGRDRLGFARAGLAELLIFTIAAVVLGTLVGVAALLGVPWWLWGPAGLIVLLGWLEVVWFFRDPERLIPADASALVSPADGKITDIGEVLDADFPGGKALRVGIFLSVFDVHVNRMPRAVRVTRLRYFPGRFANALRLAAMAGNEQMWIDLEDLATGTPLRVTQIAGAIARRIVCWLRPGDVLAAGERFGMIKIGSRTEVYLPTHAGVRVAVQVGQHVKGGETVLLYFTEALATPPTK